MIYINDLPDDITSKIKLFADDTNVYRVLKDIGSNDLQLDLDKISNWTTLGSYEDNRRDLSSLDEEYYLSGKELIVVNQFKDLGIIMSNHLTWSDQVDAVVNKANRVLGIIKRRVGTTNMNVFSLLIRL